MKPFLLITGMHRSGTSFLARALNLLGVYLGEFDSLITDDWRPHKSNLRGHWENQNFLNLTEKTLSYNNGRWFQVPPNIRITSKMGKEIRKSIKNLEKDSLLAYGFKDPRILLCFDSWKKYLPKGFVIVGIFRHPLKVAESLKIRSEFSYDQSLELWKIYNEKLLKILEENDGFLLDFDWPKKKLLDEIRLVAEKLDLAKNIDLKDWHTEELIKSDNSFQKNYPLTKEMMAIYSRLKKRSKNNRTWNIQYKIKEKEKTKIIQNLLIQIQKQGQYFKKLNDKNLEELAFFKEEAPDLAK